MRKNLKNERRKYKRLRYHYPISYKLKDKQRQTIMEDISKGGIRILSNMPIKEGEEIDLLIATNKWLMANGLLSEAKRKEERDNGKKQLRGKVVWVRRLSPQYNLYQAGIELVS